MNDESKPGEAPDEVFGLREPVKLLPLHVRPPDPPGKPLLIEHGNLPHSPVQGGPGELLLHLPHSRGGQKLEGFVEPLQRTGGLEGLEVITSF